MNDLFLDAVMLKTERRSICKSVNVCACVEAEVKKEEEDKRRKKRREEKRKKE